MTQIYVDTTNKDRDVKFLASVTKYLHHASNLNGYLTACRLGLVSYEQMVSDMQNHPAHSYELVTTDVGETIDLADRLLNEKFFNEQMLVKYLQISSELLEEYLEANPDYRAKLAD